jgi:5S rRNA maturation endonuclease (ribonuclease M5)
VKQVDRRGRPVLAFPYFNEDGVLRLTKFRLSSSSHDTYTEPAGVDLLPFGLNNPLVRYSKNEDLFIAEGETDCFTLSQFGYPTIAISGAKGWKPEFAELAAVEKARRVIIAEQQDDDGRRLTEKILSDIPDAFVLRPLHGAKDFNEMWLKCWSESEPIAEALFNGDIRAAMLTAKHERAIRKPKPEVGKPPGIRDEAFYGLAGRLVRLLEPYLEANREAILANVLAAIGVLFERRGYAKVSADPHYPIDYFLIVGDTAKGRKGTTTNAVLEMAERVRPGYKSRGLYSMSTGEGLINALMKPQTEEEKDQNLPSQAEYPATFVNLGELAGLLSVMTRDSNTLPTVLRDAWDGKPLQVNTRNQRLCLPNVSLGIIANTTRSDLTKVNPVDIGNGFINQFIFIWSQRSKLLEEGANLDTLFKSEAWALTLKELHAAILAADKIGEVKRDSETVQLWKEMYYDFNVSGDSVVDKLLARNDAHTLRLSVEYALLDRSPVIRPCHLKAARAVWDFSEQTIRFLFGGPDAESQRLMDALAENGPMTTGEIRRQLFGANKSTEYINAKMEAMEKDRRVRRVVKEVKTGKKAAWALNV